MKKIKYTFHLKHDKGIFKLNHIQWKCDLDVESAINSIMDYEKCPRTAIKKIEIKFYE